MTAANARRDGRRFSLTPARLSSRLTVTALAATVIAFSLVAGTLMLILAANGSTLAANEAASRLVEMRIRLQLQARELDSFVVAYAERNTFYEQTGNPDPSFVADEVAAWLGRRIPNAIVVWTNDRGSVLYASGGSPDVDAVASLTMSGDPAAVGQVALPSGPAVIAWRRIVGDPARDSVGTVAIARPVAGLLPVADGEHLKVLAPDEGLVPAGPGWDAMDPPDGYASAVSDVRGGQIVTRAALAGVDGRIALVAESTLPNPLLGEGRTQQIVLVLLALGVLAVGMSLLLAGAVSRSVGQPLRGFVTYMQEQGYLALQGLRADQDLVIDPRLPDDFRELAQVIVDLMTQLRINQADLIEAGEQALAAEQAFRMVVEESPEVKILVREGVVEIANPAAAHFFGLRLGDLMRASPEGLFAGIGLFDETNAPLDVSTLAARAADGAVVVRCTTPNQPDRWMEMSVATVGPSPRDYVISARNVTEERRLEALREEILSLVSHDLRSPLTVVRGYLDMLERPLEDGTRAAAAGNAQRAVERMEGLLDDLLHATRAERVFAPTVLRSVDLGWLAECVASSLQLGTEQQIRVMAEEGVVVLGDAVRLEQAATNLVGNAVKYGPADGEVRITVSTRGGRARLQVEDDGPGIPQDQRESLFERGTRGTGVRAMPGMGLGLYIVRVIAEAHGGTASVECPESGGTRFVLELPLKPLASEES